MRLPDFEAWAMFSMVAEHRSFTEAARVMGVSKATVSKAITRLEDQLDASLFHRTSRQLTLTEAGRRLVEYAARIRAEGEAAEEAARDETAALAGPIRLGAPMTYGLKRVAPLIAQFMAAHPAVFIDLHLSDERVDVVEMGLDATLRIGQLPDSSLRARKLADVRGYLVAAPSYLERHGRPGHPSELAGHQCLSYAYVPNPEMWRFNKEGEQSVTVQPTGPLRTNNGEAMLPALRLGMGFAILPDFIVQDDLAAGTLEIVLEQWTPPQGALHLVTSPGRRRTARVEALFEFLGIHLG